MIYNIALIFDKKTNKQIYQFYAKFKNKLNLCFGLKKDSIPHITIVKFGSKFELSKLELKNLLKKINNLKIDFSGVTFLPTSPKGCWIEISILKNQQLINIQKNLIKKLDKYEIKSGIEDRFRPHVTLAKTNDYKIKLKDLDYSILRKKQVNAKTVIGLADSSFEFHKL